jgi:SAM-dependent methyltransferase
MMLDTVEIESIKNRYQRRSVERYADRYSPLDPYVVMSELEKDRVLARLFATGLKAHVSQSSLLEIGCGYGGNLLRFLRFGLAPENLVGNDLLADRIHTSRRVLPSGVSLFQGDATTLDFDGRRFDVVCLFTVLSSILDDDFQTRLANAAWSHVKPGGAVLLYDFVYNNPSNPDVRGITTSRIQQLFPGSKPRIHRVTLAPPIGRRVTKLWTGCYSLLNAIPLLRSHVMVWIEKE